MTECDNNWRYGSSIRGTDLRLRVWEPYYGGGRSKRYAAIVRGPESAARTVITLGHYPACREYFITDYREYAHGCDTMYSIEFMSKRRRDLFHGVVGCSLDNYILPLFKNLARGREGRSHREVARYVLREFYAATARAALLV